MTSAREPLQEVGDRVERQIRAMAAFQRHAEVMQRLEAQEVASREMRRDARHRLEALRRTQQMLVRRTESLVDESQELLRQRPPLALVVHRNEWMRQKVAQGLRDRGIEVLPLCEDGADGLGMAIADQPDLVVLEDRLSSLSGLELVGGLLEYCDALVAAQVAHDDEVGPMLEAGASAVFTRRVPPAVVVDEVHALLLDRSRAPVAVR